jgi:hypothetical protein
VNLVPCSEQAALPVEKVSGPLQRHRRQLRVPEHARDRPPVSLDANAGAQDRHRAIVAATRGRGVRGEEMGSAR